MTHAHYAQRSFGPKQQSYKYNWNIKSHLKHDLPPVASNRIAGTNKKTLLHKVGTHSISIKRIVNIYDQRFQHYDRRFRFTWQRK